MKIYVMTWTESEAGWGQRPDGYSLHKSPEDFKKYTDEYWSRMPKGQTPHEYSYPDSQMNARLRIVNVDGRSKLARSVRNSKNGVRVWESDKEVRDLFNNATEAVARV